MNSKDGEPIRPVSPGTMVPDNDEQPEAVDPADGTQPQRQTMVEPADASPPLSRQTMVEPADASPPLSRQTMVEPADASPPLSRQTMVEPADASPPLSRQTMLEASDDGQPQSDVRRGTMVEPADADAPQSRRTIVKPIVETLVDDEQTGNSSLPNLTGAAPPGDLRKTILEPSEEPAPAAQPQPRANDAGTNEQTRQKSNTGAQRFRPIVRPPMARLFVLDDSGTDAESIRLRQDTFRIGRSTGDLVISHDAQMSGEHVEIARELKDNKWCWRLKDLNSTNGTFVRISETPLSDQQELFIGGRLYQFQKEEAGAAPAPVVVDRTRTLVAGGSSAPAAASAYLTEVNLDGPGRRIPLQADQWIGRDKRRCAIVLDDPMLGDQEARIYRNQEDQWFVKKGQSLNGLWARVTSVVIQGRGGHFQCGEQRFEIRLG